MPVLKICDDRNRELLFGTAPKRVVSLVPSDTYSLAMVGAAAALVGCTDYCELPTEVVRGLPRVGGTKNPRVDAICDLAPDLILANQEENSRSDLELLAQRGFRVFVAFPKRVPDGLAHLAKLARIFDVAGDGQVRDLVRQGYEALRKADARNAKRPPLRAFCPIWMDPLMTIHETTFISDMLQVVGATNVFRDRQRRYPLAADVGNAVAMTGEKVVGRDTRYPRVSLQEVTDRKPDVVILPDEPHPFTEEDAHVFRSLDIPAALHGTVVRTEGKDLCWYGARTVEGLPRLEALMESLRQRLSQESG